MLGNNRPFDADLHKRTYPPARRGTDTGPAARVSTLTFSYTFPQ
jgi:hypothetical protein